MQSLKIIPPSQLLFSVKRILSERRARHHIKKAELMIHNLPEWQKKDLNLNVDNFRDYYHKM